ncbi:threonine-phosphate decarboxylase CobD [Methylotenera mobilis]|uniref:threonine-phosphate decarboxylase n=1 Tax=Methylotenera mobilis (strain JLW8 / ATCC BAA-1282 / DSM 17540) TaxID=583345 RepID=C6WST5_METML|nr:threonine-phosphate decarboxylase CobD [Methylotenera mobilis]ACT47177.1 L-threonine-O-3-phosphate decarboxylase [Methylotenera mobilis JLW8]
MLEHGGNLSAAVAQYKIPLEQWLDLSTGINPCHYPIPEIPVHLWHNLPNDEDGLATIAAQYYGCKALLPTSGSQAALQTLPKLRPVCKVAMLNPMYQEHAHAWQHHGHQVLRFNNFNDVDVINSADVVLICNPNNPTGKQFAPQDLLHLHATLAKRGGWLIVDEAFMDATPEHSIAQHTHLEGLFVLRSLGKFFGLAGTRVGFLLAAQAQLHQIQEELGPWTIAGPSRYIAMLALQDSTWQHNTRLSLVNSSSRLSTLLNQYGLSPTAGTALFQYIATTEAMRLQDKLAKQGIWVRRFNEQPALRFGLPDEHQWQQLEQALQSL